MLCRGSNPLPVTKKDCEILNVYGCYGRYGCDPPYSMVESVLDEMSARFPNPDWVLICGDLAAHVLPSANLTASAINTTTQKVINAFPGIPIVVTPGNNDFYPRYSVNTSISIWLEVLATIWEPLFPDENAKASFLKGGYYSRKLFPNLEVISLNTILFSPNYQPYPPLDSLPYEHLQWLESKLLENSQNNIKVYIVGHIPPGSIEYNNDLQWHTQYIQAYTDLVTKYYAIISGQFFGHTHHDDFRVQPIGNSENFLSYFIVPSVSPIQNTNPTFRMVMTDMTTYEPVDYVQFYTDLYTTKDLNWRVEYDFDKVYNETSANSNSLVDLFHKLQSDPDLFALFQARYVSLYNPDRGRFLASIQVEFPSDKQITPNQVEFPQGSVMGVFPKQLH